MSKGCYTRHISGPVRGKMDGGFVDLWGMLMIDAEVARTTERVRAFPFWVSHYSHDRPISMGDGIATFCGGVVIALAGPSHRSTNP